METDFFSHSGPAFGQRQQPYRSRNRGEYGGDYERAEGYGYRQRPNREELSSGIGFDTYLLICIAFHLIKSPREAIMV